MKHMNNFDHLDLDGRLLRALVVVHEEGSVTRAAQRLGVTQSAVSHMLDKLRQIVGDPLFVKSGRSVVATAQAGELDDMKAAWLDYQKALIIAMKKEKAAFRLYSDLAGRVDDAGIRDLLLGLAQEEAKHKLRFEVEYDDFVLAEN